MVDYMCCCWATQDAKVQSFVVNMVYWELFQLYFDETSDCNNEQLYLNMVMDKHDGKPTRNIILQQSRRFVDWTHFGLYGTGTPLHSSGCVGNCSTENRIVCSWLVRFQASTCCGHTPSVVYCGSGKDLVAFCACNYAGLPCDWFSLAGLGIRNAYLRWKSTSFGARDPESRATQRNYGPWAIICFGPQLVGHGRANFSARGPYWLSKSSEHARSALDKWCIPWAGLISRRFTDPCMSAPRGIASAAPWCTLIGLARKTRLLFFR